MKEPEKHEDFMSHCHCFVYKDEVITENYDFGRVELIDTSKASECVKEQLNNIYLLYYDTICIAVYNQHPKQNIKTIEFFIKKYQTDTTRLSDFVKFDSSIKITIDRLCKDQNDKTYYGTYTWWKSIEYSTLTIPYYQTKVELLQTWYNWTE
ncbi:hypothetical protein [Polluticaenibacter yanchengensis]